MLGREREALQYFQDVLAIKPNHAEAASEARVLEQRLKQALNAVARSQPASELAERERLARRRA